MGHLRVHTRLGADAEVVYHRVLGGEVFGADGLDVLVDVHEALADDDLAVAGDHVSRTVGVVLEHSADGRDVGLADTLGGNTNDAHGWYLLNVYLEAVGGSRDAPLDSGAFRPVPEAIVRRA